MRPSTKGHFSDEQSPSKWHIFFGNRCIFKSLKLILLPLCRHLCECHSRHWTSTLKQKQTAISMRIKNNTPNNLLITILTPWQRDSLQRRTLRRKRQNHWRKSVRRKRKRRTPNSHSSVRPMNGASTLINPLLLFPVLTQYSSVMAVDSLQYCNLIPRTYNFNPETKKYPGRKRIFRT